jgi:hypothetical protein
MKSIYFPLYSTRVGAGHGVYAGTSPGKTASPPNPKGPSSGQGRRPQADHLHESVVLSSSHGAPENKKIFGNFQGVPKAPTKDRLLMSAPLLTMPFQSIGALFSIDAQASIGAPTPLARGRPYLAGLQKTKAAPTILRRRRRFGGLRQALHLTSNPHCGVMRLWALLSVDAFASVRVPACPVNHHVRQFALSCWNR